MLFQQPIGVWNRPAVDELLWTLSPQTVFRTFSPYVERLTGWHAEDWFGKPFQSFVHPYDIPHIKDRYGEVLAGASVPFERVRCHSRDGGFIEWSLTFVPQMESGVAAKILVLGQLIQHTKSPSELRFAQPPSSLPDAFQYAGLTKLLEGMLGNAPIAVGFLDAELRIVCLNEASSQLLGFSPSQQLGKHLRDFIPQTATSLEPIMQKVLATGESVTELEMEFPNSAGLGSSVYAQMCIYPIPDQHGGSCGIAVIAVDITARKYAELALKKMSDDLVRSNEALEQFSYIASHDLKQPLHTISNFINLLGDTYRGKLDDDADKIIAIVEDGASRMSFLIDRILDYSKAGQLEQELSEVDCDVILKAVVDSLDCALKESGGAVTFAELPTVTADRMMLQLIFQNLIANAIKYGGAAAPSIHVAAIKQQNEWVFSVSDNGIGIGKDHFSDIFKPFKRLHSNSKYSGSGLGLSICKKNVERLGGKIWVTSDEHKGATFSFSLPT